MAAQPVVDELSRAQHDLGRALGRARAGEDRELAQKVREGGEALAQVLGGLLKLSRVHAADNRAFDAPVDGFERALAGLVGLLGTVHLATVEDQAYVNEVRVRLEGKGGGGRELSPELGKHNVGGLSFHGALDGAAVRALVAAFARKPAEVAPRRTLQSALAAAGVRSVELSPRFRFRTQDEQGERASPLDAIRRVLRLLGEAYEGMSKGRVLNALPLRRAVIELVDVGLGSPDLWEAVADGTAMEAHAATVAMVALLVGQGAGLRPALLQDLGLAAMVHDAGYAALPAEAIAGAHGLHAHPGEGARVMLRQRGFHEGKLRRLRAVLDHHRDHAEPLGQPSSMGQILRLAEDYATLLRVHRSRISPTDALGAMLRAGGKLYHPALAQVMVNVLGRYPPGTLLELADGRYARSIAPACGRERWDRPIVRIYDLRTRALAPERLDLALIGGAVVRALPG